VKSLHLHVAWAIVALTATLVAAIVSRRGDATSSDPAASREVRTNAALRARVSELEAELAKRSGSPGGETPASAGVASTAGGTEAKEAVRPAAAAEGILTFDQIRALLKSSNRDDVAKALKAIDQITDRTQKLALLRMMVESGDQGQRSRAVPMLKKLGGPEAVGLLMTVLSQEGSSGARMQAAVALGELGDASALPALQDAWRSGDVQVRSGVAVALDKFGQREPSQDMVRTLGGMLQSADGGTREDAVDILTHVPMPGSLPLLVTALNDPTNNHVREDAADAMGAQKLVDSLPFLEKALQDPSQNVREAAQRAITRIKAPKP
jgi:HEAT repeat protein